jgi:2-desacetyl-2-hydroxyethyl bacteriochlorophyllide A dehydrogenase
MKALVYEGPRVMTIKEVDMPVPNQDEVLIRVECAGICGSELNGYLGHNSLRKPPIVMGHEFSGTVQQLGKYTSRFEAGNRVTVNPLITCGHCSNCKSGATQLCAKRKLIGAHQQGAFAEYVVAPEHNTYRLEDHVNFDEGALTEPFACAIHICKLLTPMPNDSLLIMGAGPIGLLVLQAAKLHGLDNITVIDINEDRLDIAKKLGGEIAISLDQLGDAGGPGKFDAAIDAVGLETTRNQCVESVKLGGKVIFTGLHEEASRLPINYIVRNEIQINGAFAYDSDDFERALQLFSEGKVNLAPWMIKTTLEEGRESFERLISKPGKIAKILLTINDLQT